MAAEVNSYNYNYELIQQMGRDVGNLLITEKDFRLDRTSRGALAIKVREVSKLLDLYATMLDEMFFVRQLAIPPEEYDQIVT